MEKALRTIVDRGVKLGRLGVVYKQIRDIGARDALAKYARASKEWQAYRYAINHGQSPKHGLHTMVIDFINRSGIYDPYNKVLAKYGMRMEATNVEKVISDRFSNLGITGKDGKVIKDRIPVPVDAIIQISFYELK